MSDSLILLAPTTSSPQSPTPLPPKYTLRPPTPADTTALAALYLAAYPPGVACASLTEATDDIRATFTGAYGDLWPAASALIEHVALPVFDPLSPITRSPSPDPLAAILTVHRAPWEGTPDCPFVVELFTAHAHRRRGLAHAALAHALAATHAAGETALALRVTADNTPALALYRSLGFTPWPAPTS